jgi:hypothetical protein
MILAPDEAALFYRAWWPLLAWVNNQRRVVPPFPKPTAERPLDVALAHPIREVLWADDALREQFLADGAAGLGAAERELVASWKHRVAASFVLLKHLQKHSIFMSKEVFGVLGLYSPLAELIRVVGARIRPGSAVAIRRTDHHRWDRQLTWRAAPLRSRDAPHFRGAIRRSSKPI